MFSFSAPSPKTHTHTHKLNEENGVLFEFSLFKLSATLAPTIFDIIEWYSYLSTFYICW